MKLPKGNTIFLIAASLVVALGIYWYFFTGSTADTLPLTTGTSQNEAQAHFETLISELGPITFDTAILSDPRFTALVDIATPVTVEPVGRTDPFAPIPGVATK